jgi:hypothetical protein
MIERERKISTWFNHSRSMAHCHIGSAAGSTWFSGCAGIFNSRLWRRLNYRAVLAD